MANVRDDQLRFDIIQQNKMNMTIGVYTSTRKQYCLFLCPFHVTKSFFYKKIIAFACLYYMIIYQCPVSLFMFLSLATFTNWKRTTPFVFNAT